MNKPCADCGGDSGEFGLQPNMTFRCPACKIKLLGHQPRRLTTEEARERFLRQVISIINFWEKESRTPDLRGKMEGLAFSMLVILDGGSGDIPGFVVAPRGMKSNDEFYKSIGEDYWPYVPEDVEKRIKCDIAGSLHDEFHKLKKGGS